MNKCLSSEMPPLFIPVLADSFVLGKPRQRGWEWESDGRDLLSFSFWIVRASGLLLLSVFVGFFQKVITGCYSSTVSSRMSPPPAIHF